MRILYSLAAFLVTNSLAFASPTANAGFTVPRVKTGRVSTPIAAHFHAYTKHKSRIPSHIRKAARNGTGSVAAYPEKYHVAYLSPVTVGKSDLMLDFDTGSSDFWVFSTVSSKNLSAGHSLFDTSSGRRVPGGTWNISYGDHSFSSGKLYNDAVSIGGITVRNMTVEVATNVSSSFVSDHDMDGVLGLGYQSGNECRPSPCGTFFGWLMHISKVKEPVFTADLQDHGGSYDFGFINSSKHVGKITYVPTVQKHASYWDFMTDTYSINGRVGVKEVGYCIMDTGTTLWYLPPHVVQDYYSTIPSSKWSDEAAAYIFRCNDTIPALSVRIGGTMFTVPGNVIKWMRMSDKKGYCVGGIVSNEDMGMSIFGDIFMRNFLVAFDVGKDEIGIAKQS